MILCFLRFFVSREIEAFWEIETFLEIDFYLKNYGHVVMFDLSRNPWICLFFTMHQILAILAFLS